MKKFRMNGKNIFRMGLVAIGLGFMILSMGACEIGLGPQVDTQRPRLNITYPPKGAVVMDSFKVAGTVADDNKIVSMDVTLTYKDKDKINFSKTFSSEKGEVIINEPEGNKWPNGTTWEVTVGKKIEGVEKYNGWDLPDGEYIVEVKAYDVNGVKGLSKDSRSITVDNTPPVFIAENFTTKGSATGAVSVFGHKINLIGQAKDEADIDKVFFSVYDDTKELLSSSVDYEMTSEGVVLAQYVEGTPSDEKQKILSDNFRKIYSLAENENLNKEIRQRYMTICLSDNARKFQNPADADREVDDVQDIGTGIGNISSEIYLKTQNFSLEKITVDDLNEYKKGITINRELVEKLEVLASESIAYSKQPLNSNFSDILKIEIDPNINPKWYVNNYEYNEAEKEYNSAFVGSPITIMFEQGTSKEKFRPSNIRIVLAKLKESVPGSKNFDVTCADMQKLETLPKSENDDDVIVLRDFGELSADLTSSLTESVELSDEHIHTPNSYRIFVFGHDGSGEKGVSFVEKEGIYGVKAVKNAQPPRIAFMYKDNVEYEAGKMLPKEDSWIGPDTKTIPFWFTVKTDGEELMDLPVITAQADSMDLNLEDPLGYYNLVKPETSLDSVHYETVYDPEAARDKLIYTFKWALVQKKLMPETAVWNKEFKFTINVTANDFSGSSTTQPITFQMDNQKPTVSIGDVYPEAGKENLISVVNGKVKVPVSFTDGHALGSDVSTNGADYEVIQNGSVVARGKALNGKDLVLDTITGIEDNKNITLKVIVKDSVGNIEFDEKTFKVIQETDKPKITFTNLISGSGNFTANSFGLKTNNMFSGSVSDDDGIGKVEVRIKKNNDSWADVDAEWVNAKVSNNQISYNFYAENAAAGKISENGKFQVQFRVTDSVGITLDKLPNSVILSEVFDVLVDDRAPEFDETYNINTGVKVVTEYETNLAKDGNYFFVKKDKSATVTVKVNEENLKSVTANGFATYKAGNENDGYEISYTWTPASNEDSGVKEIRFVAEDQSKNTKEKTISLYYDKDDPIVNSFSVEKVLDGNVINGKVIFKVDVSDEQSGVRKLVLKTKQNGNEVVCTEVTERKANFEVDTTQYADAGIDFIAEVTDKAGNVTVKKETYTINQETDKPVITWTPDATYGIIRDNKIYVKVQDDDALSSIKITVVNSESVGAEQLSGTQIYTLSNINQKEKETNVSMSELGITASGYYFIKVDAQDTGMILANPVIKQIRVDGMNPIIKNIKVAGTEKTEYYMNTVPELTFDVEEMKLKSLTVNEKPLTLPVQNGTLYSFKYQLPINSLVEGENEIKINAIDTADDQATAIVKITYDINGPILGTPAFSPVFKENDSINGKINISGKVSDSLSGVSNIKVSLKNPVTNDEMLQTVDSTADNYLSVSGLGTKNAGYAISNLNTALIKKSNGTYYTGDIILVVQATDPAGNVTNSGTVDGFKKKVDQSKDTPVLEPTNFVMLNASSEVDVSEAYTNGQNIFKPGNNILTGNISDDDGLKSVKVSYSSDGINWTVGDNWTDLNNNSEPTKKFSLSSVLPAAEGKYLIKIEIEDIKENETTVNTKTIQSWVGVSAGVPSISVADNTSVYVQGIKATNKSEDIVTEVVIPLNFTGGSTTEVTRTIKIDGNVATEEETRNNAPLVQPEKDYTEKSVNDYIKLVTDNETNKTVTVTYGAKNSLNEKSKDVTYTYKIDNTKPVFSSLKVEDENYSEDKWYNQNNFKFEGIWTDTGSGVESYEYWIFKENETVLKDSELTSENRTGIVESDEFNETIYGFGDKLNYFKIRAIDGAGNISQVKTIKLKVDMVNPEISDLTIDTENSDIILDNNIYYVSGKTLDKADKKLTITGKITDTLSGVSKSEAVKVVDGDEVLGTLDSVNSDGTFTLDLNKAKINQTNKRHIITVEGMDAVGRKTSGSITLYVDTAGPDISNTSVTRLLDYEVGEENRSDVVNGNISVRATIRDEDDKVQSTTVSLVKKSEPETVINSISGTTDINWEIDTTTIDDNTEYQLMIVSADRVGNESTLDDLIFYVCQDSDKPIFEMNDVDLSSETGAENRFGIGSWTIRGSVKDDDGISSVIIGDAPLSLGDKVGQKRIDFSYIIPEDSRTAGVKKVIFSAEDTNETAVTNSVTLKYVVDNEEPAFGTTTFYMNGLSEPVPFRTNLFATKNHKIEISVSDDNEVLKLEYQNGNTWTTENIELKETVGKTKVYVHTLTDCTDGEKINHYLVTDIYGRTKTTTISYIVDTLPPVVNKNDCFSFIDAVSLVANSGYYNADSIKIRAVATTGANVKYPVTDANLKKTVEYAVYPISTTGVVGTIAEDSGNFDMTLSSGTVQVDGKAVKYGTIPGNVRSALNGSHRIVYTFSDEAQNTTSVYWDVKFDNVPPTYQELSLMDVDGNPVTTGATNAEKLKVSFQVKDDTSGALKAYIGRNSGFALNDKIAEINLSSDEIETWSPHESDAFSVQGWGAGNHSVYLRLIDKAGNQSSDILVGTFEYDIDNPMVTISDNIVDADPDFTSGTQVCGTVTLTGSAIDDHFANDVKPALYIGDSEVNKIGTAAVTNYSYDSVTKVWSVTLDTTKLSAEEQGVQNIKIEFTDIAGNKGNAIISLDIDQTSDCPVINLIDTNPDPSHKTTLRDTVLSGYVKDNDVDSNGIVKNVYIAIVEDTVASLPENSEAWTALSLDENGKWTHTVSAFDGKSIDNTYKVFFKVIDNKNKTFFTSNAAGRTSQPKFLYNGKGSFFYDAWTFSIDSEEPQWGNPAVEYSIGNDTSWLPIANGQYYGGVSKGKVKFRVNVHDALTVDKDLKVSIKFDISDQEITVEPSLKEGKSETDDNAYEFVKEIDFTTLRKDGEQDYYSGRTNIKFNAADETKSNTAKTYNIIIDNTPPTSVTKLSPDDALEMTGVVTIRGIASDNENGKGIAKLEYMIPERALSDDEPNNWSSISSGWITLPGTNQWIITLDNLVQSGTVRIQDKYAGWDADSGRVGIYLIPIWFRITDELGNVGYNTSSKIRYNPNDDMPAIDITYPVENTSFYGKSYVLMGGKFSITGTASDKEGIEGVYIQYDINGDGRFDLTDYNYLKDRYIVTKPLPKFDADLHGNSSTEDWGIKAAYTNPSWRTEFDAKQLTDWESYTSLEVTGPDSKTLNFRVLAVDNDTVKIASGWTDSVHISINNSIPQFSQFKFVQRTGTDSSGKIIQQKDYQEGSYLSGYNWYLEGSVSDNDGISDISYSGDITNPNDVTKSEEKSYGEGQSLTKGHDLKIPVVPENSTKTRFTLRITAYDNAEGATKNPQTADFSFYIDNVKPAFNDSGNDETLAVFIDRYGISNNKLSENKAIQNSNEWTTISSKVRDSGTGFEKSVFYITREFTKKGENKGKTALYNITKAGTNNENRNFIGVSSGIVLDNESTGTGLPLYSVTSGITHTPNADSVTVVKTGIWKGNLKDYIKSGHLVRITEEVEQGVTRKSFKKIDTVTGTENSITVKFDSLVEKTITAIDFVCGFVVDENNENRDEGGDTDGDGIREYMTSEEDTVTWEASFDSSCIPDGPVTLHVVVFDGVDNFRYGSVSTHISNNAPRLARVTLGTDLNGDGSFASTEQVLFNALDTFAEKTSEQLALMYEDALDVWDLNFYKDGNNSNWKLKDTLKVQPEFVGGTAPFYYVFSKEQGTGTSKRLTKNTVESGINLKDEISKNGEQGKFDKDGYFTIPKNKLGVSGDYKKNEADGKNTFRFSFWDSAEEATPGVDSNTAVLNVEMVQDLVDDEVPKAFIHPFFWKGKSPEKNSVHWNNNGKALGHIELEGDDLSDLLKTTYGLDPKVSGEIIIRGTAYDNNRVSSLTFVIDDISMTNCTATLQSDGTWNNPSSQTENWQITVNNSAISQSGHWVNWELKVDTSKVQNFVGLNKKVTVKVSDGRNETTPGSNITEYEIVYATEEQALAGNFYESEDAARNRNENKLVEDIYEHIPVKFNRKLPAKGSNGEVYEYKYGTTDCYQFDIMPYVYEVETELSSLNTLNPSIYNRTARGRYPVRAAAKNGSGMNKTTGEKIKLHGFNLNATGVVEIQIDGDSTSTDLDYKVQNIPILNNINKNDAKGSFAEEELTEKYYEEYCYNRCPNGKNNNLLDDNIAFDVWDINDCVAVPVNGLIQGAKMKINPQDKMIQYAATFGILYYGMGGNGYSIKNVKTNTDTYINTTTGFYIDAAGNTYGTGYCGREYDSFKMVSSRWQEGSEMGMDNILQGSDLLKKRFFSTSFASSADSSRLYLAYYDALNDQIRFKAGTFDDNRNKNGTKGNAKTFGQFNNTVGTASVAYDDAYKYVQIIAGHDDKLAGGSIITTNGVARNAGQYVSIVCVPGKKADNSDCDVICAVWYDANKNALMYSYKVDPISSLYADTGNNTADGWSKAIKVFDGGEYCKIVADGNNHLHIAAYGGNGDVLYAYLPSYSDGTVSSNFKTCIVDSYESVGENLTLDVALDDSGNSVPYIGYYSGTMPKYAYLYNASAFATAPDGAVNEKYTGDWEVTVIPTKSSLKIDMYEAVNVGVWKNENGVLIDSKIPDPDNQGKFKVGTSTWSRNAGTSAESYTYGNGTKNGVLLYQVANSSGETASCLETAQKR